MATDFDLAMRWVPQELKLPDATAAFNSRGVDAGDVLATEVERRGRR